MATLEQYRAMLYVNKHRLDDELEVQPDIMDRISNQVVVKHSRMLERKDELAKVEGRLGEDLKEDYQKLTVGMIDAKVKRDPERITAWNAYQAARSEHEQWVGLLDAWRQKGYSIKTLADLYAAQYFSVNSTSVSDRQRQRNEDGDVNRAAMRRAGNKSSSQSTPVEEVIATRRRTIT